MRTEFNTWMADAASAAGGRPCDWWLGGILLGYLPAECAAITEKSGNPVLHFAEKIEMVKSNVTGS